MHFVYKLDHLFKSTRVSDENSSVTKKFHFSKLISTQDFFLHPTCNIQIHILKFQPFLTSFAIFQSTRVSDENSSVTKTFLFSKLISTQDFFCIQHATFKATYSNFNPL